MAIDVLKIFEKNTTENVEDVLVVRFLDDFGMDCIELAILCKCERFISHTTVQNILETIWKGKIIYNKSVYYNYFNVKRYITKLINLRMTNGKKNYQIIKENATKMINTCALKAI